MNSPAVDAHPSPNEFNSNVMMQRTYATKSDTASFLYMLEMIMHNALNLVTLPNIKHYFTLSVPVLTFEFWNTLGAADIYRFRNTIKQCHHVVVIKIYKISDLSIWHCTRSHIQVLQPC